MALPTRNEFEIAARQVKAILQGEWTIDAPSWADGDRYDVSACHFDHESELSWRYTRAVWTAEAYIQLFAPLNARFDRAIFLYACGLGPKPTRKRTA